VTKSGLILAIEKFSHHTLWRLNCFYHQTLCQPKFSITQPYGDWKNSVPQPWVTKNISSPPYGNQMFFVTTKSYLVAFFEEPSSNVPPFLNDRKKKVYCHQTMGVHSTLSSLRLTCWPSNGNPSTTSFCGNQNFSVAAKGRACCMFLETLH
jgi:hypothetical protein